LKIDVASETDEELVSRCQADRDDPRSFEALVRRHQGYVMANCRSLSRSATDAEDLAQEVFTKVFFSLPRWEARGPFRGWLTTVKVNHCLNFLRSRRGKNWVELDEVGEADQAVLAKPAEAERMVESGELRSVITQALDRLSDTIRVPLVLCDADGLSYEEIAEQLGIGLSAVKMRIKRGREEFRRHYTALTAEDVRA
jgi:RNA polymerase sigma-70 factor, ECF subfamily